ncbi:MAG: hypothetical protein AAGF20_01290 [Pseudomonadota bacterium]
MASNDLPLEQSAEDLRAQKRRNVWLAMALFAFVVIVGVTTAIRIQDADLTSENSFYFNGSMSVEDR